MRFSHSTTLLPVYSSGCLSAMRELFELPRRESEAGRSGDGVEESAEPSSDGGDGGGEAAGAEAAGAEAEGAAAVVAGSAGAGRAAPPPAFGSTEAAPMKRAANMGAAVRRRLCSNEAQRDSALALSCRAHGGVSGRGAGVAAAAAVPVVGGRVSPADDGTADAASEPPARARSEERLRVSRSRAAVD
jgi:hypothetical protein